MCVHHHHCGRAAVSGDPTLTGQRLCLLAIVLLGTIAFPSKARHVTQAKIPLLISAATPDDMRFVFNSWKMSALDAPKNRDKRYAGRTGEHFTHYNKSVEQVLAMDGAHVLVAREPEDPTFIYGWIAFVLLPKRTTLIAYQYVKSKFRRLGVASQLKDEMAKMEPVKPRRYFCESTVSDATYERWGFELAPLEEVLKLCEPRKRARKSA